MASAGQAQAHSSQPMHFSSPSGHRFSWWRPWNRGAVAFFSSGYWTVSTFLNICRKVTPKPLTGPRNLGTGHLLDEVGRSVTLTGALAAGGVHDADPVVVGQVQWRPGESAGRLSEPPREWCTRGGTCTGRRLRLLPGGTAELYEHVPLPGQQQQDGDDRTRDDVDRGAVPVLERHPD